MLGVRAEGATLQPTGYARLDREDQARVSLPAQQAEVEAYALLQDWTPDAPRIGRVKVHNLGSGGWIRER